MLIICLLYICDICFVPSGITIVCLFIGAAARAFESMKLPMITNPTGSIGTIVYLPTISPYKSAIHVGKWVFPK